MHINKPLKIICHSNTTSPVRMMKNRRSKKVHLVFMTQTDKWAVVSREYGLPCVVGLQGATKRFRTGDYVLLDGKKGILQRLPPPEE
ncbi:PEP-utilizers domain-containing protein [Nephila pilipes]|uniref:PEP-utilizers domain-containing protein n=1 Tax=Nephila pilipes TaxID=299642 RepID=A0A8X6PBB5_NEPPI|nr:PEP-utilizers domain-containing protein [Nephila pilipes]